jgi:acetylglutamate kinase
LEKLYIIKIGGSIIDDEIKLSAFLKDFASIEEKKILVHGGGKLATQLAMQMNVPQQMIEGRRITDSETLKIVTMVYAGYINKNIVAQLQSFGCNALGLSGADGNVIQAHKREHHLIDYGLVGDIDEINSDFIKILLDRNITIVFAPITHDKKGGLLNTNADTITQEMGKALSNYFETEMIYSFEKEGVLLDASNEESVIDKLDIKTYNTLKEKELIFAGMIPKLDNAFLALKNGVSKVVIGKAEKLKDLICGKAGTQIVND